MTWLATRLGESRILRVVLFALVLGGLVTLAALHEPARTPYLSAADRAHAAALFESWLAASRAERCERQPLREPATGDGRADYAGLADYPNADSPSSPLGACLDRVEKLRQLEEPCTHRACPMQPLEALLKHPEVVQLCAPLFAIIERHAHTTSGCSPIPPEYEGLMHAMPVGPLKVPRAVRYQVAALVARGELREAARDVTNALRYDHDYGRNGTVLDLIIGRSMDRILIDTLDEIMSDPRWTAEDARAIVDDLDIILADSVRFDQAMRGEILDFTNSGFWYSLLYNKPGDREQERSVMILGHERWLAMYQRVCGDAPLAVCAGRLRTVHTLARYNPDLDTETILASSADPAVVRERMIDNVAAQRGVFADYAIKVAILETRLRQLRAKAAARAAQP